MQESGSGCRVRETHVQRMTRIEVGGAAVRSAALEPGNNEVQERIGGALVDRMRPGIRDVGQHSVGKRTLINRMEGVVAGCAVAFAFHILTTGRFASQVDTGVFTVTQIATGAAMGAATFWWAEPVRIQWSLPLIGALAVTSLFATALAFFLQTWAQRWTSPTRTALIFAMEPVFAWITSFLLLGEVLSGRGTLGALLILGGVLMVELKPFRAFTRV